MKNYQEALRSGRRFQQLKNYFNQMSPTDLMKICRIRSQISVIYCLLVVALILSCFFWLNSRKSESNKIQNDDNQSEIDRIRQIFIANENLSINNNTYSAISLRIPWWISRYRIAEFFNFYWLKNGGYHWHLQKLVDAQRDPIINSGRILSSNWKQSTVLELIENHPEIGVLIDTATDPIQSLFSSLPQTGSSLIEVCQRYSWLKIRNQCRQKAHQMTSISFRPLTSFVLYNVTLRPSSKRSKFPPVHHDHLIHLFNSELYFNNETSFLRQILPRLIRLLALTPNTTNILLMDPLSKPFVRFYLNILVERGLISDQQKLIPFDNSQIYHSHALYSTSLPRSDLLLLNRVLIFNKTPKRRDLIVVIEKNFSPSIYRELLLTIDQFESPEDLSYLHVHQLRENNASFKEIHDAFERARLIIGMPTEILSNIVWCSPGTHVVEILDPTMTDDYFQMSLELKLHYWFATTTKPMSTGEINMIDFRHLMLKIFSNFDT